MFDIPPQRTSGVRPSFSAQFLFKAWRSGDDVGVMLTHNDGLVSESIEFWRKQIKQRLPLSP